MKNLSLDLGSGKRLNSLEVSRLLRLLDLERLRDVSKLLLEPDRLCDLCGPNPANDTGPEEEGMPNSRSG